jgi:hypothetical protein
MTSAGVSTDSVPVLVGTRGWVSGELYVLKDGESVVLGRSRSCDISLRRIVAYLERSPGERDADHDFNTVSRRHMRLTIIGSKVKVEDLSTNGSYCNDDTLSAPREISLDDGPVELRLGTRECFRLELADPKRLDALRAASAGGAPAGGPPEVAEVATADPDAADSSSPAER